MSNNAPHITEDLLAKYFSNETSPEENARITNWLEGSTENQATFDAYFKVWYTALASGRGEGAKLPEVNVNKAWDHVRVQTVDAPHIPVRKLWYEQTANWMKIAAVVLIIAGAAWVIQSINDNTPGTTPSELTASANEDIQQVVLSDTTRVWVNKGSSLSYPEKFTTGQRRVKLEGEAFFEVAPDQDAPFIIDAGLVEVRVVGTSFNVKTDHDGSQTVVSVYSGVVIVSDGDQAVELTAGMESIFDPSSSEFSIQEESVHSGFWANRTIKFKRTPLLQVAETLAEYYAVDIRLGNSELESCRLTAQFEDLDLDAILDIVATTLDLEIEQTENQIILHGKGC